MDAFVRRSVDEFHKLFGVDCWHYVESKLDPADSLSRSLVFFEILQNNLRFRGS